MQKIRKHQITFSGVWLIIALAILWIVQLFMMRTPGPKPVSYTEFLAQLRAGHISTVQISQDEIIAQLKPSPAPSQAAPSKGKAPAARSSTPTSTAATVTAPTAIVATRVPGVDMTALVQEMESRGVVITGHQERPSAFKTILWSWVPLIFLFGLYWYAMRRLATRGGPLNFGKAQAKIYDRNAQERVTFADVAGVEEAKEELVEVVSFLKNPARYRALGARIPKGVLLVGAPGTGKTLLARAVAGEANVPFFSLSGSEFVEMFVGVGASRVRSLFEQAKTRAPCIIFIDELDAIGKTRGGAASLATHDEREQTLNQLLVEMDGFDPGRGVIIMAATNRPEVLDPALLRPGRFDRQVVVDRPTADGRLAILQVHSRHVKLAGDVDLHVVAQRTVGMVGADLANVVNEAALAAGRRNATEVHQRDFEEAIDRIQLGLKRHGKVMSDAEKRRVAFHESGHALVALSVKHADPVHSVSIIPRTIGALGTTLQLPTEDRYLITREELLDRICVMLGGRAAEELTFEDVSTGAHNDLERATETARQMVSRFGMSDTLGPVTFGRPAGPQFLRTPFQMDGERNYSEDTARTIDAEVRRIMDDAHERARKILGDRRATLQHIAETLLVKETLERPELDALIAESESKETQRRVLQPQRARSA